ncbi:MAG: hypothetical protein V1851_02455 [Patescibacteria group bacterium]
MFCPRCGGVAKELSSGGSNKKACIYCGKGLFCRDSFSGKIEKNSLPHFNLFKALWLRFQYNRNPRNKKQGRINLQDYKSFRKQLEKSNRKIANALKNRKKILKGFKKEFHRYA